MTFGIGRMLARGSWLLLAALMLSTAWTAVAFAQVDVTATSGTPFATYATLKLAFDAINAGTQGGALTIDITASTTEGTTPATLNSSGTGSASYTSVLIRPTVDGVSVSGNPAQGFGVIQLNGADNVILDGDNPNTGGTNRNLTVANTATNTTTYTSVIRVATLATTNVSADNITIRNLVLNGNATGRNLSTATSTTGSENTSFGVIVGPNGANPPTAITSVTGAMASGTTANAFAADNCAINQCARGIAFLGTATSSSTSVSLTNNLVGDQITNNVGSTPPYTTPSTTVYTKGIIVQGTTAVSVTGNTVKNLLSYVGTAMNAIELTSAIGATVNVNNNTVTTACQNTASNAVRGLLISSSAGPTTNVNGNAITNINIVGGSSVAGMEVSYSGTTTGSISRNSITTVRNRNTGGFGAWGIRITAGSGWNINDNSVAEVLNIGTSSFGNSFNAVGISLNAGSNHKVYHNSVNLFGASTSTATNSIACLSINASSQTGIDIRNNTLSNKVTGGNASEAIVCLFTPFANTAMTLTQNNNAYFSTVGTQQGIAFAGATSWNAANLYTAANFNPGSTTPATNYRAVSTVLGLATNDNSSLASTTAAPFVSNTDLHIPDLTATQLESGGAIGLGIATDFDGQTFGTLGSALAPDLGFDEFAGIAQDLTAPSIVYTPLLGTCATTSRTLTATITDASGIPTNGIGLPVLHWKINAGAWTGVTATWTGGSSYDFTFGSGVVVGDVVSYYILAQDGATPPNVGSQPAGAGGLTADPPAAGTPPSSPSTYAIQGSLAGGTYSIPGAYATLTAAVADYNSKCLGGPIVFELAAGYTSAGETFPITINTNGDASAVNTLTIRPAAGQTQTITGSLASGAILKLNGADWVVIDGSNSGGTDRNLTITNTATTAPCALWLASQGNGAGATNNIVKNCILTTSTGTTTTAYGISVSGATIGSAGGDNDNVTIQNNAITSANVGVYAYGNAAVSAGGMDNLLVSGNAFTANSTLSTIFGVQVGAALNASVAGNTINLTTTATGQPVGISIETNTSNSTVTSNRIQAVVTTASGGYGGRGITIGTGTAGSNITVANNFVAGVNGSNWNAFGNSSSIGIAIGVVGGSSTLTTVTGGVSVYHNSISMTGSMGSGSTTAITTALYVGSGASTLNIRNNIITNTQVGTNTSQKNYGVYSAAANTAFTSISYNDYYVSNSFNAASAILGYLGGDQTTLTAFNTAFTGSPSTPAYSLAPGFVSNTDLHIPPATTTLLESGGAAGTGINLDVDNEARPGPPGSVNGGGTANDVGADEFDGTPLTNNDIAATAFVDPVNGGSKAEGVAFAPQASFTNLGLAAQTDVTVRYRIVGPSPSTDEVYNQVVVIGSIASLGVATVTFPSVTITTGGTYAIYAVSELAGDQAPANDQITGTISVLAPLAGSYTVGLALFNRVTGADLTFVPQIRTVTREVVEPVVETATSGDGRVGPEVVTWRTLTREVEETVWVPMSHGQKYDGSLSASREQYPDLPADGGRGVYATLTAAVTDLNGRGLSAPVEFLLVDATYPSETFPITFNVSLPSTTPTNTVTVRPASGVTSNISGTVASGALIKLNGVDYVTIDGSNSGGTDRSLTLTNAATTAPCAIWLSSLGNGAGATYDTVKNCIINTSAATASTAYGIAVSGATIASAGGDNDDVTIQNNAIASSNVGIYANGNAAVSAGGLDNLLVADNAFTTSTTLSTVYGVQLANALGAAISGNTFNITTSAATAPVAIDLEANVSSSAVTANRIQAVVSTATGGYAGRGITIGTGTASSAITIANNFIAGVNGSNWSSFGLSSAMGIAVGVIGNSSTLTTVAGGINIYHNSISMTGSMGSGSTTAITTALYVGSGASTLNIRNNIITNTQVGTNTSQKNYGVYSAAANTAFTSISYNDYYVSNSFNAASAILGYLGGDQATLTAFNTAFTGNPSTPAFNVTPGFVNNTDLHIPAATVTLLESGGVAGTGITVDVDDETRPGPPGSVNGGGTGNDVGADEFDGTPVFDNDLAATAFVDPVNGGTKSVGIAFDPKASFSNLGLLAQTDVLVRYRIVGPLPSGTEVYNQTATIAAIASLATTTVTFPSATLPAGGSYTIYASSELAGDQSPANDQITGAISALEPMAGVYTVGLSLFNRAAGTELTFEPRVQTVVREVLEPLAGSDGKKSGKDSRPAEQLLWKTVRHEVEEVTWVAMADGRPYDRPLRVSRIENPDLPAEGGRGVYPTITAAVADLNARGVSGPVTFVLTDATYPTETFPIVINVASAPPNASNPVTIKPNSGVISTVAGASASGSIFKIYNTNYVTIDGSNSGGLDRSLTLENTSTTSPNVVWFGSSGTTPVTNGTLRNCVVRNGSNGTSAVVISDGTTAGTAGYFADMEIRNNRIEKAYIGVYTNGGTSPANGSGLTYADNDLSATGANAIRHVGLYAQGVTGLIASNNEIGNLETTSGENDFGIWIATGVSNATVSANRIHDIAYTGTSGYGAKGIAASTGVAAANVLIANNMIFNLTGDGDSYASYGCTYAPVGIYAYGSTAQGGIKVYDNSIYLYGNTLNFASDAYSVGIGFDDAAAGEVSGNNVVNNLGRLSTIGAGTVGVALETASTQLTDGNYNNYYCSATGGGTNNVGKIASADYATLATWQTASGRDANSISADPQYVSTTNLHVRQDLISPVSNAGTVLAGVTSDFDGDARSLTTPDIGADEFTIYTLSTSVTGAGTIEVSPLQPAYAPGTPVTLTAVPADSCHTFRNWSGDAAGSANPLNIVMDANKVITAAFGPAPAPVVAVTAPNGGENWTAGTAYDITWTATSHLVNLTVDLEYSTDGGATYPNVIASGLPNSGTYSWLVPDTPSTQTRVRVVVHDPCGHNGTDHSDADFTIQSGTDAVADILLPGEALGVFPNPAAPGNARVLYRLPAGTFSVDVYDVSGRLVRTLDAGNVAGGLRTVKWDGRDANGTTMATGIYLVRLHTSTGLNATKRLILFQQ